MVLAYSDRIPRVPPYSGYSLLLNNFAYGAFTLFHCAFQHYSAIVLNGLWSPSPQKCYHSWFGLFRFRSPLLSESLFYFLFLRVIRCFSSPGSLHYTIYSCNDTITLLMVSFLIRISTDQRIFAPNRSFSQLVTSFFGAMYQGILRKPFVAWSSLFIYSSFPFKEKTFNLAMQLLMFNSLDNSQDLPAF